MEEDYLSKLTTREQCRIIHTVNCDKGFDECPVQGKYAKMFFNSLMKDKARLDPIAKQNGFPGVVFDMPELEDDDEESKAIQDFMFDGMNFDDIP